MNKEKLLHILELSSETLGEINLRCIETRWNSHDRKLQVFVDYADRMSNKEDPLEIDACVKATRVLDEKSGLDDLFKTPYELEVSSPGIERPIRLVEDFRALVGETIHLHLSEPVSGRRKVEGVLEEVLSDDLIRVETETSKLEIPLRHLLKANLVYDWNKTDF